MIIAIAGLSSLLLEPGWRMRPFGGRRPSLPFVVTLSWLVPMASPALQLQSCNSRRRASYCRSIGWPVCLSDGVVLNQ